MDESTEVKRYGVRLNVSSDDPSYCRMIGNLNGLYVKYEDYAALAKDHREVKAFNHVATLVAEDSPNMGHFIDFQDAVVNAFGEDVYKLTGVQLVVLNHIQQNGPLDMEDEYGGFESMRVEGETIIFVIDKHLLFTISKDGSVVKQHVGVRKL